MRTRVTAPCVVALIALAAGPAAAQHGEPEQAAGHAEHAAAGHAEHGAADHAGHAVPAEAGHDPSRHFNFLGLSPGHLFDYLGKDALGGPMGDGKMVDTATGHVVREEEPASPPFVFMLLNFAVLLGLLAWKGKPVAQKVAADRYDLIKTALDEAAKLRKQAADKLAEYEARLKDADAQIKQLVDGMRTDAENEKQRILAAAEAQAALMKRDAEVRIAAEIELARAVLTREVAVASTAVTEKLLREKMTAGDQQALVATFITDVQNAPAVGRGQGVR
jgi:F-type H+-transporting ATPase subunit b